MNRNKKVLHVVTVSFVINHFFGKQFHYLKSITNNDYFLGCSESKELFELSNSLGYKPFVVNITRNISPFTDIKSIIEIYKFIKKNNINIVVGHTPKGGFLAMIAGFLAGVENRIYFRHGIVYETSVGIKKWMLKNIERISGILAKKVVCVSLSVKKISEHDNLNNHKKNIILGLGTCNGIDTENKFNPELIDDKLIKKIRKELQIAEGDFVVGYVGRLVKDKGINELLEAWVLMKEKYNNIKLLLVGPIETKDSINNRSKEIIKNDSDVINTGFVLNSAPYFNLLDVFVLPTYREGFPTVALEASSMKVPVLITKATGCTESIVENETGIFISNNPKDIFEKIETYIKNKEMREKHGFNGRKFVRKNFQQSIIWNEINSKLGY